VIARVGDELGALCGRHSGCVKPNGGLKQRRTLHTICPSPLTKGHRQFNVNQAYVSDITYIPTGEGWLYLAVVIDLYSRQVVGWSMAERMKTKRVNDALIMAI
jgi:transposase InsO family protein